MLGLIVGMAAGAARHAVAMIVIFVLLAVLGVGYAAKHLSIDTDTDDLFAKNLPWRQAQMAENRNFPQFNKLIVAVVRARTPEEAKQTAAALNAAIHAHDPHAADKSMKKLAQSCDDCHDVFKEKK